MTARSPLDKLRDEIIVGEAIRELPPLMPLIDDFLYRDTTAMLWGETGACKTFVAMSWALAVATGSWWFGHRVEPGRVLYVVAEGAAGFGPRVDAWKKANMTSDIGDQVFWLPVTVNLFRKGPNPLAELALEVQPDLTVIDTFARNAAGADENSSRDVGLVIERADEIRRASGGNVLIVHHSGKDISKGARGSSALEAALDNSIHCKASDDGTITLTVNKARNEAGGHQIRLRLEPIGDSCALVDRRCSPEPDELRPSDRTALAALQSTQVPGGIAATAWKVASDLPERTFYLARKRLLDRELIQNIGTNKAPRYLTTATATELQEDCK